MAKRHVRTFENQQKAESQLPHEDLWRVREAEHIAISESSPSGAEVCILRLQLERHLQASLFLMPRRQLIDVAKEVLRTYEPTSQDEILAALDRIEAPLEES